MGATRVNKHDNTKNNNDSHGPSQTPFCREHWRTSAKEAAPKIWLWNDIKDWTGLTINKLICLGVDRVDQRDAVVGAMLLPSPDVEETTVDRYLFLIGSISCQKTYLNKEHHKINELSKQVSDKVLVQRIKVWLLKKHRTQLNPLFKNGKDMVQPQPYKEEAIHSKSVTQVRRMLVREATKRPN